MDFMRVVNKTAEMADMYITGDILDDSFKGLCKSYDIDMTGMVFPSTIMDELKKADGKTLHVHINSGGGNVFAGTAIANYLANRKGHTVAVIDGLAGSIASVIACGCDEIHIPDNAYFMIHKPSMGLCGFMNSDELLEAADTLDVLQDGITNTYMNHVKDGVSREKITELINNETWLTGVEACEYFNFVNEKPLQAVACSGELAEKLLNTYAPEEIEKMRMEIELELELL